MPFVLQGGRLVVELLHYPLLLRWADWYRGSHPAKYLPSDQKHDGPHSSGVLRCTVAGAAAIYRACLMLDGHNLAGNTTPEKLI